MPARNTVSCELFLIWQLVLSAQTQCFVRHPRIQILAAIRKLYTLLPKSFSGLKYVKRVCVRAYALGPFKHWLSL